ncbi:lactonase family protein [Mycetocola spongiae]|uniref:lactonase family protein n=1 Tax=Mycetocola spongiae TaxID=2859226 RepID=UPI001CF4C0BB|nr:beta-propeller fold lactonase family protein [Mycetocola spongiae]UCR88411.1 lactonase family protein [Mycetocola spongiae]
MMREGATRLWLGSYTADMDGVGEGISSLEVREDRSLRQVNSFEETSPSFLTAHPTLDVFYGALEGAGRVQAYHARARPSRFGPSVAAGDSVCHLAVTADGALLLAACYGDGAFLAFPLGPDGAILGPARPAVDSVDPHRSPFTAGELGGEFGESALIDLSLGSIVAEQAPPRASHAHASVELEDGRIASTDLGHDAVRIWRRTPTGVALDHTVALPLGVGPRHLVTHQSGHLFVVTEYSTEIFTLGSARDGRWRVLNGVSAVSDGPEEGDYPSEISRDESGNRLYVSVRGSNRIATLEITGDGSTLRPLGDREAGGNWPRHHLLDGDMLHVANQLSNNIASFQLDARGLPSRLVGTIDAGSPTCLLVAS